MPLQALDMQMSPKEKEGVEERETSLLDIALLEEPASLHVKDL